MKGSELWTENQVLREKLFETQRLLEQERNVRLNLQAENLWLKKVLREPGLTTRSPSLKSEEAKAV